MDRIDKVDYSTWTNVRARELAQKADTDNVKGLQGQEIFNFVRSAKADGIEKAEISELLGMSISAQTRAGETTRAAAAPRSTDPNFDKAVDYYNNNMTSSDRYAVTFDTYDKLSQKLYEMEKAIDKAYQECDAYTDDKIVIVPRSRLWYYRDYPYWDDRLTCFDIEDLRTRTTRNMQSLVELKEKVAEILGDPDCFGQSNTEYDVDEIAQRRLGMSYEEFASKYSEQLERFKYITIADVANMSSEDRAVYARAKAYAQEMLNTTIMEAHTVNWDIGELKLDETLKATDDMFVISDFEYDGITEKGLNAIKSGIMFKAFEEALINKYRELDPTGIEEARTEEKPQKPIKRVVNGAVLIFNPDGTVFDLQGRQVK